MIIIIIVIIITIIIIIITYNILHIILYIYIYCTCHSSRRPFSGQNSPMIGTWDFWAHLAPLAVKSEEERLGPGNITTSASFWGLPSGYD